MDQNKKPFLQKQLFLLIAVGISLIVLTSSLFFANYGIVNAEWNARSNIEGFQINNATGEFKETVYLHIDNSSMFSEQLIPVLQDKLQSYTTTIKLMTVVNETRQLNNASFLGIHVTEDEKQYYPWSAENKYTVFYYYSDTGNTYYFNGFKTATSLYDNPVVFFNSSDADQLLNIGDITIQGSFNGFFSHPRMQEMTIEYIFTEICKQVE